MNPKYMSKRTTLNYLLTGDTDSRLLAVVMGLGLIVAAASIAVDGTSIEQFFAISAVGINNGEGLVQTAFAMRTDDDGGGDDGGGGD